MSKRKKRRNGPLVIFVAIICVGVMSFSGYKYVSTMLEYKRGVEEYDGLRQYAERVPDSLTADAVRDDVLKCPIKVDFSALRAINEDVIGWLYIEALDLSYPIVHGEDNDYYLHRTFERKYNFAGSIFIEADNSPDFTDPNTIIYGHNMKNDSMFGSLDLLVSEPERLENPFFWILTPDAEYCYEMFSLQEVPVDGEVYTLFEYLDESFIEYAEKMAAASKEELPEQEFTLDSRIATLSTCTQNDRTRLVLQGVFVGGIHHGSLPASGAVTGPESPDTADGEDLYESYYEKAE